MSVRGVAWVVVSLLLFASACSDGGAGPGSSELDGLVGHGVGIHWPRLDEDLSVRGLLAPARADQRHSS